MKKENKTSGHFSSPYKLLVFDFDGTLVDLQMNWDALKQEIRDCLAPHGIVLEGKGLIPQAYAKIEGLADRAMAARLRAQVDELSRRRETAGEARLLVDKKLFAEVRKQFAVAIHSNNTRTAVVKFLKRFGIDCNFIVTRDDVRLLKPDAEGLRKVLDHFGVAPAAAAFFGDSDADEKVAAALGVRFFLVRSPRPFNPPYAVYEDVNAALRALLSVRQ